MKRLLISLLYTLLVASLLFGTVACNSGEDTPTDAPTDAPTEKPTETPTEKPTSKPTEKPTEAPKDEDDTHDQLKARTYNISDDWQNFKYLGRMGDADGGVFCDFTASGVEFAGKMVGDVTVTLSCDRETYFTVFIDGVRVEERFRATSATKELTIATFAEEGEHHIRFLKQTEPPWSLCVLKDVKITGELGDAPANREYLIEFIGDSITCGYGNLGNSSSQNPGSAPWEDGTKTYAFLTAEALGADATVIGCSGIGIDKGWTSFSEKDFYPAISYYRDKTTTYLDFIRVPDLVVINLGTNDQSRGSTEADFKAGVEALIKHVRSFYGEDMPIVWAYNMMGNGRFDWTRSVLADMGGEAAGLYSVELTQNNAGGGGHPNLDAQITAGEQLTKFITDKGLLAK